MIYSVYESRMGAPGEFSGNYQLVSSGYSQPDSNAFMNVYSSRTKLVEG